MIHTMRESDGLGTTHLAEAARLQSMHVSDTTDAHITFAGTSPTTIQVGAARQRGGGHPATHFRKGILDVLKGRIEDDAPKQCGSPPACHSLSCWHFAHAWTVLSQGWGPQGHCGRHAHWSPTQKPGSVVGGVRP